MSKHSVACLRVKIEGGAGKNGWRSKLWHWETLAVASELWSPVRNIVVLETLQSSVYHVLVVTVCTTVQGTQSTKKAQANLCRERTTCNVQLHKEYCCIVALNLEREAQPVEAAAAASGMSREFNDFFHLSSY